MTSPDRVADLSSFQAGADLNAYRAAGRSRVVLKASQAPSWRDHAFGDLRSRARGAGLAGVGCYHFAGWYAGGAGSDHVGDPTAEALNFLDAVGTPAPGDWPVLDHERQYGLDPQEWADWAVAWLAVVAAHWQARPWFYTPESLLAWAQGPLRAVAAHADLWLAGYPNRPDPTKPPYAGPFRLAAWQYSDGTVTPTNVPGVGNTDDSYLYIPPAGGQPAGSDTGRTLILA